MDVRDKIRNPDCTLCPLHEEAEYRCLMGSGPLSAKVMIIGEAPGQREDEEHAAFVGPAGKLLRQTLTRVGINPKKCYITNVAKCRPPDNRTPERSEIKTCVSNYLLQEIEEVSPDFILLLGNSALRGITGRSGITKHRGSTFGKTPTVFATYHPAAILRNPRLGTEFEADLQRFARLVSNEAPTSPTRVRIIRTPSQLKWLCSRLRQADVIAYDIETYHHHNGLQEWHGDYSKIVSIGFSWEVGTAVVVPLDHETTPWAEPYKVLKKLKPYLEDPDKKYVAHNGKFDCRWLAAKGVFVPQTFDTMLAAHMLDENRSKGLKPLSQVLLGVDAYDVGDELGNAYYMDMKKLCIYNGKDCDYTLRLYHLFKEQLKSEVRTARVFVKLMMPASNALTQIERGGLWVDNRRLSKRIAHSGRVLQQIRYRMTKYLPHGKKGQINFNSPAQLADWFFNDLELPIIEETPKGAPSTKESVLLQLAKLHPAPALLLKYRKWTKYQNTYLTPWLMQKDRNDRLHTTYKLFGTVTGRLSSADPNLQQVPRDRFIRSILGAPPGWKFVEADYSQVELRVAAMLSQESRMLRSFSMGEDIHLLTACQVTGKAPEDITPEERKKAKAVNFGFLYGMGAEKFTIYARDNYDVEVSLAEAEKVRARFFETYPALRPWHERQRRLAVRYGRVHSPIGRIRHLPDVQSQDKAVRAESERQAINSPVQSFASDLMLVSLLQLHNDLDPRQARIVGTVHDAILFEVRDEALDDVVPQIRRTMEDTQLVKKRFGADVTVPIRVDIKVGQHWGEGTEVV